ncbi:MAG: copper chaperone PCu(A)C [Rickettsia endosymbiont of Oxypoda opaca]|nr:copper chaperone PCu(A)C [Rickettsia endosymbiont of Oxypoda opaca]
MNLKTLLLLLTSLTCSVSYATSTNPPAAPAAAAPSSGTQSDSNAPITAMTDLSFINPWARPAASMAGKINNSAMYLIIKNDSGANYNLINVSSDIANKVELHQTFTDEKGISKMVKLDNLVIPTKTSVELKPGGAHIMLYDLKQSLKEGDEFKVYLFFDDSSMKTIKVKVANNAPTQ